MDGHATMQTTGVALSADVLALLACPACYGELAQAPEQLTCIACGRMYPLVDGIPVLLADHARAPR